MSLTLGSSLLGRTSSASTDLSPVQSQVDGLVGGFAHQATDLCSLAAIMAGGMAYRVGRVGVMGLGSGNAVRVAAIGLGLGAEVSTFELIHRGLSSVSVGAHGRAPLHANLWRWSGPGGLRQGLLQSFITFGALKGAGRIARGENLIAQHLFQDTAMVLGHNVSSAFDPSLKPTGSMAEQFLHAEATNLQIGAGMALVHRFAPGLSALERGLDLSLQFSPAPREGHGPRQMEFQSAFALAGNDGQLLRPVSPERKAPGANFMTASNPEPLQVEWNQPIGRSWIKPFSLEEAARLRGPFESPEETIAAYRQVYENLIHPIIWEILQTDPTFYGDMIQRFGGKPIFLVLGKLYDAYPLEVPGGTRHSYFIQRTSLFATLPHFKGFIPDPGALKRVGALLSRLETEASYEFKGSYGGHTNRDHYEVQLLTGLGSLKEAISDEGALQRTGQDLIRLCELYHDRYENAYLVFNSLIPSMKTLLGPRWPEYALALLALERSTFGRYQKWAEYEAPSATEALARLKENWALPYSDNTYPLLFRLWKDAGGNASGIFEKILPLVQNFTHRASFHQVLEYLVESSEASKGYEEELFGGLLTLRDLIRDEASLRGVAAGLVDLGRAAGENTKKLLSETIPEAKYVWIMSGSIGERDERGWHRVRWMMETLDKLYRKVPAGLQPRVLGRFIDIIEWMKNWNIRYDHSQNELVREQNKDLIRYTNGLIRERLTQIANQNDANETPQFILKDLEDFLGELQAGREKTDEEDEYR